MRPCKIGGYDIPAKTRIHVNAWAIGRDPETRKNPEEFYPKMFEDNDVDFRGNHYELIPFWCWPENLSWLDNGFYCHRVQLVQICCIASTGDCLMGCRMKTSVWKKRLAILFIRRFALFGA
ncbi:Uncharacterized protein Fot_41784 [Forsythia ovata]|uniref:Uncharacterized protein n=1 Tax=Forsythia ovata TaxID=205694 RepID=A0ABD1RJC4_9LAMI